MLNLKSIQEKIYMILEQLEKNQKNRFLDRVFEVKTKHSECDFVTSVDIETEQLLIEYLLACFPNHAITGEESKHIEGSSEYEWLIDPIDGTTNFVKGIPYFSISIALKHKGEVVMGIVSAPMLNMRFSAIRGQGAFLNHKKIEVSKVQQLNKSIITTGFPPSKEGYNANAIYFNKIIPHVADIRRMGSAALDICFVALGSTDAYWEIGLADYDIKAGECILSEAGGRSQWLTFGEDRLIIATNTALHNQIVHMIKNN